MPVDTSGVRAAARTPARTVPAGEARRELGLSPREFRLAVELGEVAPAPGGGRGPLRVPAAELAALRAEEGFPHALRERLRLVGAREGAAVLGAAPARFVRLARAGRIGPVRFALNRYRAVVWLYRAVELRRTAERQPELLGGRLPEELRRLVEEGVDRRPRRWRGRRVAQLLRLTDDPWEAAAVHAAVLPPDVRRETVPDEAERVRLEGAAPRLAPGRPESAAARRVVEGLLLADCEEEVLRHRLELALALDAARSARPPTG